MLFLENAVSVSSIRCCKTMMTFDLCPVVFVTRERCKREDPGECVDPAERCTCFYAVRTRAPCGAWPHWNVPRALGNGMRNCLLFNFFFTAAATNNTFSYYFITNSLLTRYFLKQSLGFTYWHFFALFEGMRYGEGGAVWLNDYAEMFDQ